MTKQYPVMITSPKTKQEEISLDDLIRWRGALASCAIEGNEYAIEQLELWKINRPAFIREYIRQEALIAK